MFGSKIKISSALMAKLEKAAAVMGCSSVEEYAERILTTATDEVLNSSREGNKEPSQGDVEAIAKKLKGLGYLE